MVRVLYYINIVNFYAPTNIARDISYFCIIFCKNLIYLLSKNYVNMKELINVVNN